MTSPELCLDLFILCLVFFEACTAVGCLMTANQRLIRTSYKHTYISSAQFTSLLFPFSSLYISYMVHVFFYIPHCYSFSSWLHIYLDRIIRNMKGPSIRGGILHIISTSMVFSNLTFRACKALDEFLKVDPGNPAARAMLLEIVACL